MIQNPFKTVLFLMLIAFIFTSCGSDNKNKDKNENESKAEKENRNEKPSFLVEYTLTQQGGDYDGQTFSNTLGETLNSAAKFKKAGVSGQFDNDHIIFGFTDDIGNTKIKMTLFIMLDADENPQPLTKALSTGSTITLAYSSIEPRDLKLSYVSGSKSGALSFDDLDIGAPFDWNEGIAPATFDVGFKGDFIQTSGKSGNQDVQISGRVRLYRSN